MLEAVRRSAEAGQAFGKVFSQQWVLTENEPGPLPSFQSVALGRWSLWHGRSLDVAAASDTARGWFVAVLGQAVDLDGRYVTDDVLADHLSCATDLAAFADDMTMLGGRHLVIVTGPELARIYLDPSGCLGTVYSKEDRRAGASLFMVLDRDLEPERGYPFASAAAKGAARFAFGATPDARVKRLLANHYLDLTDFSEHRHWPSPHTDLTCPMTEKAIDTRIETVIARQRSILKGLLAADHATFLPLSGGDDSRLLLALSKPFLSEYRMIFAHRTNSISGRDVAIAKELSAKMGIPLEVIDAVNDQSLQKRPRFIRRMNARRRLAQGFVDGGPDEKQREIEVREVLPVGGAVLRGNVTDVSKAVLWRRLGIAEFLRTKGQSHNTQLGLRLMMLGPEGSDTDPWCSKAYEAWREGLPQNAQCRALDFSSIEQFRCHGQGSQFYAFNRNFYQTPSADRTILEALISLPPHLRDAFYINDRIIEMTAPELSGVRYTRDTANKMRAKRQPLADLLNTSTDRL